MDILRMCLHYLLSSINQKIKCLPFFSFQKCFLKEYVICNTSLLDQQALNDVLVVSVPTDKLTMQWFISNACLSACHVKIYHHTPFIMFTPQHFIYHFCSSFIPICEISVKRGKPISSTSWVQQAPSLEFADCSTDRRNT